MASIIGNIVCTPSNPLLGESVLVEVQPASGQSFDPSTGHTIYINGIPSTRSYLQFIHPGSNTIRVQATGPQGPETKTIAVQVQNPPPATKSLAPALGTIEPPIGTPIIIEKPPPVIIQKPPPVIIQKPPSIIIHEPPPVISQRPPLNDTIVWPQIGVPILQLTHLPHQLSVVGFAVGQTAQFPGSSETPALSLPALRIPVAGQIPLYEWNFGDGSTIETITPSAQHDFSDSLNPLIEHQSFDVSVTSAGRTVIRTLTFTNLYAMLKRTRSELHPHATASGFAIRTTAGFSGSFTINNPESQQVSLTELRFVPLLANNSQITVPSGSDLLHPPIILPSKQLTTLAVNPTFIVVPRDSIGFSAYYFGYSPTGERVRVNVHFDLDPQQRSHSNVSIAAGLGHSSEVLKAIQDTITQNKLSGATLSQFQAINPSAATFQADRAQLSNDYHMLTTGIAIPSVQIPPWVANTPSSKLQSSDVNKIPVPRFPPIVTPRPSPLAPDPSLEPPAVGNKCYPDNLPDPMPIGLACQATTETLITMTKGRFMNARKGDTVLAPGGVGTIGQLLTHVDHPQHYSHTGIMTSNHDQITHCTAIDDRIEAYPMGSIPLVGTAPTDGFRTDVLKYGWPGTMTQTVENSVIGEERYDPEGGAGYNFHDFDSKPSGATIEGYWHIIPPFVVKPDPMYETEALRQQLHAVADDAFAHTGKYHYRFYCYTDPTIVSNASAVAPASSGWANGTAPAVCSSFIWECMKRNGMHLAGANPTVQSSDLTQSQKKMGAKIGPATPDGLYLYSASERHRAAQFLHGEIYNKAQDKINQKAGGGTGGFIVELVTKLAEHISNEFMNAFTRDIVNLDDDDGSWVNTADANAVSPDNIMLWNGPTAATPGPYGYVEPLIYREPRYDIVKISRWRPVHLTGTLNGTVTFQGSPIASALVTIDNGESAGTDANGNFSIATVPYGPYTVSAQKAQDINSVVTFLTGSAHIDVESPTTQVTVPLSPPPDLFRTVIIDGTLHVHWDNIQFGLKVDEASQDFPFHLEMRVGPYGTHHEEGYGGDVHDAHAGVNFVVDWQLDKSVKVNFTFTLQGVSSSQSFSIIADGWSSWKGTAYVGDDDARVDITAQNTVTQA